MADGAFPLGKRSTRTCLPSLVRMPASIRPMLSNAYSCAAIAEIAIDHTNALDRPARCNCAVPQRVLALRALAVFGDLPLCGLADIQVRITLEMIGRDLELRHAWAPWRERRECRQ